MKKVELLSPAGDMECLKSAVLSGADAVYISGKMYGARKFANNFSLEEIEEAIKFSHLYGVKVYITINTLIYESEIEEFISYVEKIHSYGVDAVIMQDIGMISLVSKLFPNLEIHASTQVHNHNYEGIKLLENLGVKRIVLDREMSLDEINNIDTKLEKEVFVHGALCVSYSGECLFSSVLLNRSGNRGECAGLCRLPYELLKNDEKINTSGDYILSMKELNCTSYLKNILDSNISSLKIEGRMKGKEYVSYVTRIYRKLIDAYYNNEEMNLSKEEEKELKVIYNREFTKGFINNESKDNIVNNNTPNHQGIYLGDVLDCKNKIKIRLNEDIKQGDGIRLPNKEGMIVNFIYNEKDLLINGAPKGSIIYIDNKVGLNEKGKVLKTYDVELMDKIKLFQEKRVPISFFVKAKVNENLIITIKDGNNEITKEGILLSKSNNITITEDDIKEKLGKLGNTPFILENIIFDVDNDVFIPLKELNNLRRELCDELIYIRENSHKEVVKEKYELKVNNQKITTSYNFLVNNEEQLKYLLNKNVNIYVDDPLLYKKYKSNNNVYFRLNRVLNSFPEFNNENLVASELGAINKYSNNNNVVSDIYLNVTNSYSVNLLNYLNVNKISLSYELQDEELNNLINNLEVKSNLEIYVYGKVELMIMKYCPIKANLNKNNNKCGLCSKDDYKLKMQNGNIYSLKSNNCLTKVLNNETYNNLNKIDYYKSLGISNFRFDLTEESIENIEKILRIVGVI